MKRIVILSILLFSASAEAAEWYRLDSGISYKTIEINRKPQSRFPFVFHVFKVNPKKYEIRPMHSTPPTSVRNMSEKNGALIGVNANFFDIGGGPLGLIISKGKTKNPFKKISWWGVFYMEGDKPRIVHSSQFQARSSITTAIQAGPRLVVAGGIPKLKPDASPHTAVGINTRGELIFLVTHYPVPIKELAELMAKSEKAGGLNCRDAINFDGGSSTQLYAKIGLFELKLPNFVGVPVGLGVFRK